MDSSVKVDESQNSSMQGDGDNKLKLFEKIVYFSSGSIGDEVSIDQYAHEIFTFGIFNVLGIIGAQKQQCRINMFVI